MNVSKNLLPNVLDDLMDEVCEEVKDVAIEQISIGMQYIDVSRAKEPTVYKCSAEVQMLQEQLHQARLTIQNLMQQLGENPLYHSVRMHLLMMSLQSIILACQIAKSCCVYLSMFQLVCHMKERPN